MDWLRRKLDDLRVSAGQEADDGWDDEEADPEADVAAVLASLPDVVRRFERRAYLPVTEAGDFGMDSGFGGLPYVASGIDHPSCPNCGRAMPLLAQLALDRRGCRGSTIRPARAAARG